MKNQILNIMLFVFIVPLVYVASSQAQHMGDERWYWFGPLVGKWCQPGTDGSTTNCDYTDEGYDPNSSGVYFGTDGWFTMPITEECTVIGVYDWSVDDYGHPSWDVSGWIFLGIEAVLGVCDTPKLIVIELMKRMTHFGIRSSDTDGGEPPGAVTATIRSHLDGTRELVLWW